MKTKFILIIIAQIITSTEILLSQSLNSSFSRRTDLQTGIAMQTWSTGDDRITEVTIPVTFIMPINKNLTLSAVTSSAMASLTSAENTLNGLTDSRITATYLTPDNHFLFTAGVVMPTGKTGLQGDQSAVASALAVYPLDFNVPSFGQGLSLSFSGVCAYQLENYILGGGLALVYKNGFKPYTDSDLKYKPGTEFSINIGGETNAKNRGPVKFTLDLTYTMYGADQYDGTEVFEIRRQIYRCPSFHFSDE